MTIKELAKILMALRELAPEHGWLGVYSVWMDLSEHFSISFVMCSARPCLDSVNF